MCFTSHVSPHFTHLHLHPADGHVQHGGGGRDCSSAHECAHFVCHEPEPGWVAGTHLGRYGTGTSNGGGGGGAEGGQGACVSSTQYAETGMSSAKKV